MSAPTYELTTIADIFNKVPADRIATCCEELGTLLATTKFSAEMAADYAKKKGILKPETTLEEIAQFKYPIKWIDDGAGEITNNWVKKDGEDAGAIVGSITIKHEARYK